MYIYAQFPVLYYSCHSCPDLTTADETVIQSHSQETPSHAAAHAPSYVMDTSHPVVKRKKGLWSRVKKKFRKKQHSVTPHYEMDDENIKHEPFDEWEVWGDDGKYEERRITWPKPDTQEPATSCFSDAPMCDQHDVISVCSDYSDVISMNPTTNDITTDNTGHDDTECSDNKPRQRKKGLMRKFCSRMRKFFRGGQSKQKQPAKLTKWGAVNDLTAEHSAANLTHWGGIVNLAADTDF